MGMMQGSTGAMTEGSRPMFTSNGRAVRSGPRTMRFAARRMSGYVEEIDRFPRGDYRGCCGGFQPPFVFATASELYLRRLEARFFLWWLEASSFLGEAGSHHDNLNRPCSRDHADGCHAAHHNQVQSLGHDPLQLSFWRRTGRITGL